MNLEDHDVILITLDSCRFDTAQRANTPHIDRLGAVNPAETPGTYTLPAHVAFFTGHLPALRRGVHVLGGNTFDAIWRSNAARHSTRTVAIPFKGRTIMEYYRARGFQIVGAGGVTFFDPSEPSNWLPSLFDRFYYFGRSNRSAMVSRMQDRDRILTLTHIETLLDRCLAACRFFLFINCPCTHVPYTTPLSILDEHRHALLTKLYALHDSGKSVPGAFTTDETATFAQMQTLALEWADQRIGVLFDALVSREPLVVVCADHGEEFGEGGRFGHGHPHPAVTTVPLWSGLLKP